MINLATRLTPQRTLLVIAGVALSLSGCGSTSHPVVEIATPTLVQDNPVPGTVTQDWEEPMYDQVKIPGQLDPTATYYRNPHSTVVEIRSGRYQEVEFPDDKPAQKK